MPVHKLHNVSTASTDRVISGGLRDRHCKKETHSLPLTRPTLKFQLVNQQLATHLAGLIATSVGNLLHRRASGQASNSSRLLIYVHATRLMASPVCIPTLWHLPQPQSAGVLMEAVLRAHLVVPQLARLVHSAWLETGMEPRIRTHSCMAARPNGLKKLRLQRRVRVGRMVWQYMTVGSCRAAVLIKTTISLAAVVAFSASCAAADRCADCLRCLLTCS